LHDLEKVSDLLCDARRRITSSDLKWADIVFVMEQKHKQRIRSEFPGEMKFKEIHVLDIPDEYRYMDAELVELLQECVPSLLGERDGW
jgi:predicted protein tyrosine phosphatase